jgi:hypothetical protein
MVDGPPAAAATMSESLSRACKKFVEQRDEAAVIELAALLDGISARLANDIELRLAQSLLYDQHESNNRMSNM